MKVKRAMSVLLALMMLMLSAIPIPAFAAQVQDVDVTVTVDKTSVKAGESIVFSFSYDRPVSNVVLF